MIVDPFFAGVATTIFIEMAILVLAGIFRSIKK